MLQRYLVLWLLLSSTLAVVWPQFGVEVDPFVGSKTLLGYIVALTMFCIGMVLPVNEVKEVSKRWWLVLGGTAVQYASMPALAYLLALAFQLPRDLTIGLIMVGCVPGAMASNVLTMVARGNVSFSVGLTTSATLLSPLVVPLALKLTLQAEADQELLLSAAMSLRDQVVLPVIGGFVLMRIVDFLFPIDQDLGAALHGWIRWTATALANLAILWIIAVVAGLNRDRMNNLPGTLLGALVLLNLLGYLAGYWGGRLLFLTQGMRRALMLEVGMQNAGVGASLATGLFPDEPGVALPCGLFAFGCMFTGTALAQWLGRESTTEYDLLQGRVDNAESSAVAAVSLNDEVHLAYPNQTACGHAFTADQKPSVAPAIEVTCEKCREVALRWGLWHVEDVYGLKVCDLTQLDQLRGKAEAAADEHAVQLIDEIEQRYRDTGQLWGMKRQTKG